MNSKSRFYTQELFKITSIITGYQKGGNDLILSSENSLLVINEFLEQHWILEVRTQQEQRDVRGE
jgi:hypothetical protein